MKFVGEPNQSGRLFTFVAAIVALAILAGATPAPAQTFNVVADIPDNTLANPGGDRIVQGRNGDVYAVSSPNGGVVFSATTGGILTNVYQVGGFPLGVALGTDGNLYGTGQNDGTGTCGFDGCGLVYRLTPTGVWTVIYDFPGGTGGSDPAPTPVEGSNGLFYGVTDYSAPGFGCCGNVYSVNSTGTKFNILHTFEGGSSDGSYPHAGLTVGSDGNLYGGTSSGGANDDGVLFRVTPGGTFTVLYNLCSQSNCADGYDIEIPMVLASDGNLYGATYRGGAYGGGVFFRLSNSGVYTVINPGVDENGTVGRLTQGTDGNLYGIFGAGGSGNYGQIYSMTTSGVVTILHSFCQETNCTDGNSPSTPVIQHTDGLFYGLTGTGGGGDECDSGDGCGVFYSLDVGLRAFVQLVSTSGAEGTKVGILGQGFTSSSVVEFGGVQATAISREGSTFIDATIPAGALTGAVSVTTGERTLTSSQTFDVTPTFAGFDPPSGPVGTQVTFTGTGLTQTTRVTFNGTSAAFTVNSDTQVTATVPTGATSGKIRVITKGGSAASASSFTVN